MKRAAIWTGSLCALALAGCQSSQSFGEAPPASGSEAGLRAELLDTAGRNMGSASATQAGNSIRIVVDGMGLPLGAHGAHVHAVGACSPPDFTSAGPHWNPTQRQHGKDNPAGAHAGDLPNLLIGADGRGSLQYTIPGARPADMMDGDGAAIVIHATADDYRTDPSGNSGGRIACGVFR